MNATRDIHLQPRSVLWFLPSLQGGGAERVCIDLANEMSRRRLDVTVVTAGRAGAWSGELSSTVRLIEFRRRGVLAALPKLVRLLRRSSPDALVSVMDHVNLVAWAAVRLARSNSRVVFTTHVDFSHAFEELSPLSRRLVLALYRLVYRRADVRIAVSRGVADSIAVTLGLLHSDVTVIENPLVPARIRALANDEPAELGPPPLGVVRVVALGRLVAQKDFETLIRGVAIVARSTAIELVILGEGCERQCLEQLVRKLGLESRVHLPGFLPNPYRALRDARVFVSSSRWEGFGMAIVEAMVLGVPVVATDCPSGPREILANGAYGRLVPVGDPEAIASAILAAVRDPGPIAAARRRAADFAIDVVAGRYMDVVNGTRPG